MHFSFTEEQQLLKESVSRFLDNEYTFNTRCKISQSESGFSEDIWRKFAELGWLSLGIPEHSKGLGGGAVETSIVMERLGHALVVEPYISTLAISGHIFNKSQSSRAKSLLSKIAEGKSRIALATTERQSRFNIADIETTAKRVGGGYKISGKKCVVFDAEGAHYLLVSARTEGHSRETNGINLFLIDNGSEGITARGYRTVDGRRAADIDFNIEVDKSCLLHPEGDGYPLLEYGIDVGIVGLCAEAVGIMQYLHEATLEYLKTRQQFGQPLAKFQALQHRMVDLFVAYKLSLSMAYMAAVRLEDSRPEQRRRAVSAAKVQIGQAGRHIGEEAIQLHGGMGMTDELAIGHYFKRLTMIERTLGDTDHHLRILANSV